MISLWNVSNVKTFRGMFYNAKKFNQNISNWILTNAIDTGAMFQGADLFNINLCTWGTSLATTANQSNVTVTTMFGSSGCPIWDDPLFNTTIPGPFCHSCSSDASYDHQIYLSFNHIIKSQSILFIGVISFMYGSIILM